HPRVDPAPQLLAVDGEADQERGAAEPRRPELFASSWRIDPGALGLGGPGDPLSVPGMNRRRDVRVELAMERLGAPGGDHSLDLLPQLGRDRWSKVEVRQSGAQVEPGAPDHDWPSPF